MKNITCCFTGHRPNKMFGYDLSDAHYQRLAKTIRHNAEQLYLNNGVKRFITGGALGFDTISFFAIESLKKKYSDVENILAVPFDGQQKAWRSTVDLDRYDRMHKLADDIVLVENIQDYKASTISQKLNKRNHFMVDQSDYVITYHDGTSGGTKNCLDYAKAMGVQNIINIF